MSAAEQLSAISRQPSAVKVIEPGSVLVELHLQNAVDKSVLFAGLKAMRFATVKFAFVEKRSVKDATGPAMKIRFVGRLTHAVVPTDTDAIHWHAIEPVTIDPFRPPPVLPSAPIVPFVLEAGAGYEMRFVSRVKARPTADDIADALDDMGFDVRELIHLSQTEDDLGNLSIWFGRAVWDGPMSVVTPNDPFYFEQVAKIDLPELPDMPDEDEDENDEPEDD